MCIRDRGTIDESELATCFSEVGFTAARQKTSIEEIQRWVRRELARADTDKARRVCAMTARTAPYRPPLRRQDGVLTFNEFVKYYNMYVAEKRRQFDEMYSVGPEVTCSFDVASQPSTAGIAPH